ncbi:hypothetical protein KIN20_029477 [Parelaphostrongylus tenuis]|uniref:Uncharacterized protein n=1 Tax=Parelaphostrongylus tenuis TaxID=148309 RepID=A0AAD5R2F6_PARTN|nr:hypothetical protein KIN20_029477 [Parelaphostrongylus tenuis]
MLYGSSVNVIGSITYTTGAVCRVCPGGYNDALEIVGYVRSGVRDLNGYRILSLTYFYPILDLDQLSVQAALSPLTSPVIVKQLYCWPLRVDAKTRFTAGENVTQSSSTHKLSDEYTCTPGNASLK